jgi:hypothetical protein
MLDEQPGVGVGNAVKQVPGVGRVGDQVHRLLRRPIFRIGPEQIESYFGVHLGEPLIPGTRSLLILNRLFVCAIIRRWMYLVQSK